MALLGQSAFLKALGWALLNSIWQMAALWVIYLVLTASLRKLSAEIKHSLSLLLLSAGSLWFAITLAVKYFDYSTGATLVDPGESSGIAATVGMTIRNLEATLPYLSSIYLASIVVLFIRFVMQYRYTKHLSTNAVHKLPAKYRIYVQQVAESMGIKKSILVWLSELVDTPMTIGFWKPVILMPIASVNGLNTEQVEAILLHELAHIRRNDYLVNLMISSIEIILFFNPFSHLFIRSIRKERENSCDDLVMQFRYSAHSYASALLMIEQGRCKTAKLAMAASGSNNRMLLDRVKRILKMPVSTRYNNRMVAHLFAACILAVIAWSNPGNVIARQILEPTASPLLAASNENSGQVFYNDVVRTMNDPTPSHAVIVDNPKQELTAPIEPVEESYVLQEEAQGTQGLAGEVAMNAMQFAATAIHATAGAEMRDFSIAEQVVVDKPETVTFYTSAPFVPSTSFSYYFQDSTKPGMVVVTKEEKAARESLKKALKALEEINWEKLEKELKESGEKIDIAKLQMEIKRSLKQVDWEKVNAEAALEMTEAEARKRQDAYLRELTAVKSNAQMQEHYRNLQKKVIEDQIKCQQEVQQKENELKEHLQKKNGKQKPAKKVVVI